MFHLCRFCQGLLTATYTKKARRVIPHEVRGRRRGRGTGEGAADPDS